MELDFWATIDLGPHRNADITVTVNISKKEYSLLKRCCRDDESIDSFDGLEKLYQRIIEAVKDESDFFIEDDDDVAFDEACYSVAIPDEIYDAIQD